MAGTSEGGKLSASKIRKNDPDFFKRIGAIGGSKGGKGKGFGAMTREKRQEWGRKGGSLGSRAGFSKDEYLLRVRKYAMKHGTETA